MQKKPLKLNPVKAVFVEHFDILWTKLFTSPVHLDSAISKAPPSMKAPLAEITRVILQRPNSIAHYLGFRLSEGEPWGLTQEELADWPTARAMAERLFKTWKQDPDFKRGAKSFDTDFPPELMHEWRGEYGHIIASNLARALADDAPLSLRVTRQQPILDVLSSLNDSGVMDRDRAKLSKLSPVGITIASYAGVLQTEAHKNGWFEIQDEGSQIMSLFALWPSHFAKFLHKAPGKFIPLEKGFELPTITSNFNVIDACAGAGGKSLAMADALRGRGQVFSYDISERKLLSLRQRAKRAGVNNIKTVPVKPGEESVVIKKFLGKADLVLVDAPCSGWGVLRRNPDIKWRQDQDTRERMPELQFTILNNYAPLVKPGGRLVYGVCTFRKSETINMVARFLEANPDFKAGEGGFLGPHTSDGFFMQSFTRNPK